jgi:hypothetical protein
LTAVDRADVARWATRAVGSPPLIRIARNLGDAPLTTLWLLILFATTRIQRSASPRRRRRLLRRHSTNLRHLDREPVRVLGSSLFWLDDRRWWPYVPAYLTVLAPAERRLGWWRWLLIGITAHFVGTYAGQGHLRRAIRSTDAPRRLVDIRDVGVSYFLFGALGALSGYVLRPWRSRCQALVIAGLAGNALGNPTHTEVGHMAAFMTGLACAPFVPNRDHAPFPSRLRDDVRLPTVGDEPEAEPAG